MSYTKCLYTAFAAYAPPTAVYGVFVLAYGSTSDTNTRGSALGASCSAGEPDRKAGIRRKRDKDLVNPCAEFNSLQWRMSYASRKEECNALSSCVFIGRAITGACAPRDPSILIERSSGRTLANVPLVLPEIEGEERKAALRRQQTAKKMDEGIDELNTEFQEEEDEQLAQWRFRELMDALDVEEATQQMALAILREEGMPAVQEFVKVQLANAAAEELRFQKASTEAFAKEFLIQVLQNEELPGHFGKMLERIFKDPSLATGIRQLIYTAVGLDHTFRNSLWLTRDLVTWLLTGTDWMDEQALRLCVYLVGLDETKHATSWLISWAISKPGILDPPTSRALAQSIPLGSEQITEALRVACVDALQSQWAHELAKATTLSMLQLSAKDKETAKGESPPSEEKIHVSVESDEASSDLQEVSVGGNGGRG